MADKPKLARLGDRVPLVASRLSLLQAPHAVDRIRGRRLQTIRQRWFTLHPLCVHCEKRGIVRQATDLDHIIALGLGGRDEALNRQGLCHDCHAAKTLQDIRAMGAGVRVDDESLHGRPGGQVERQKPESWKPAANARAGFFPAIVENASEAES